LASFEGFHGAKYPGTSDMARKTNYDFERREREKSKAADSARKAQAKIDRKASEADPANAEVPDGSR
jgi:hypothetical protein